MAKKPPFSCSICMDWLERLNRGPGQITLGRGTVELLSWAYAPHFVDNRLHRHTYFEICQVGAYGAGQFIVRDQPHEIGPGDLFIARPGVVHQVVNTAQPGMELRWMCFQWVSPSAPEPTEIDRLLRAFAESEALIVADERGRIAALWQTLRVLAGGKSLPGSDAQVEALIAALLLAIAQAGAGPLSPTAADPPGPDAAGRQARLAVRYVHDNLNLPMPLPEIAAHIHMSPRHLSRLFARFTGTSPAVYIARARMDRACGLLCHSDLPIKDVAEAVGYPDVHHFTRIFTRYFGCPPARFRRDHCARPVPNIQSSGAFF